jgi:hypothetical protein
MRENLNASARLMVGLALVVAAGLASGCMSSPTYGTDKTASEQLATDLTSIASISPKKKAPIDYTPRPELVKPAKGEAALPPPQESVVTAGNPNWPEAPEQRLARVRAEADENADNPNYRSSVVPDMTMSTKYESPKGSMRYGDSGITKVGDAAAQREEVQKRIKESQQGESTSRKFLSEPPLDYRQASADAPTGETGEDESTKERRLKREARKKYGRGLTWDDINPF